jgi:hypothetical protein
MRKHGKHTVLFPEPLGPTIAVTLPASNLTFNPSRICTFGRLGYEKATSSNEISASEETSGAFRPDISGTLASIVMNNSVAAVAAFPMAMMGATTRPMEVVAIMTEKRTLLDEYALPKTCRLQLTQ